MATSKEKAPPEPKKIGRRKLEIPKKKNGKWIVQQKEGVRQEGLALQAPRLAPADAERTVVQNMKGWEEGFGFKEKPKTRPIIEIHFKHCSKAKRKCSHIPCPECGACIGNSRKVYGRFAKNSKGGFGPTSKYLGNPTIKPEEASAFTVDRHLKVDPETGLLKKPTETGRMKVSFRGRPEKIIAFSKDDERVQHVLRLIKQGNLVSTSFRAVGIGLPMYYDWAKKASLELEAWRAIPDDDRPDEPTGLYARLWMEVDLAVAEAETRYHTVIFNSAVAQKHVGTAMWRLERMNSAFRGSHVTVQEGGAPSVNVNVNASAQVTNVKPQVSLADIVKGRAHLYDALSEIASLRGRATPELEASSHDGGGTGEVALETGSGGVRGEADSGTEE